MCGIDLRKIIMIGGYCLGDVIRLDKNLKSTEVEELKNNNKKKTKSALATVGIIVGIIAGIFSILGISVVNIHNHFFSENWQEMAQQYNNKGLDLYNSGRYEEAIEWYDKAIALETKKIEDIDICYFNRGRAYYILGNYEKAIGDFSIAIGINPRAKYYSQRALAYKQTGDTVNEALDNVKAVAGALE